MRTWDLKGCGALLALAALVTGGFSPSARAQVQADTAAQMAAYCGPYRHALRLAPRGAGGAVVEAPGANAKSDFCWGAFATMQDLATLRQAGAIELYLKGQANRRICLPITVERLQMVQSFLQYMDHHRDMGGTDFGMVLLYAMSEAYPCAPGS